MSLHISPETHVPPRGLPRPVLLVRRRPTDPPLTLRPNEARQVARRINRWLAETDGADAGFSTRLP